MGEMQKSSQDHTIRLGLEFWVPKNRDDLYPCVHLEIACGNYTFAQSRKIARMILDLVELGEAEEPQKGQSDEQG